MTILTHNNETLTLEQWSKKLGMSLSTIRNRKRRGLSPAEILEPVKPRSEYSRKALANSPWKRRMVW